MTFVYDLILNFNDDLYEFYEWEKNDFYYHVKRINLIKIKENDYDKLLLNNIKINDDILLDIFNKCEIYEQKKVKEIPYGLLVTDSVRVMGIIFNSEGLITKYSSLLLDEEEDVLEISNRLPIITLAYNILDTREISNLTRNEKKMIKYIEKDINNSYKNKNYHKLKYLYYEYFNIEGDDIEKIYHELLNILYKDINKKHYDLYNLIKLSYSNNNHLI